MNTTKVDIQIIGRNYSIECADNEVSTLETAAAHINTLMHEMRRQAPNLEHDKLLVLTCLTICKDMFDARKNEQDARQSARLLEKMIMEVKQMVRS